ncbi:MAG: hypothetical protein Kow0031_04520 [Anaerolineae bacterium]
MKLSAAEITVLTGLAEGRTLKSHRNLDGEKAYRLHPLDGLPQPVDWAVVDALKRRGLIDSNKKFPAATYLLTEKGRRTAEKLLAKKVKPLSARNY